MSRINADYLLAGGDVRFRVVEGRRFMPTVSVGGGYTYLEGNIGIPDVTSSTIIDLPAPLDLHSITVTSPELTFALQTSTFVGKVQASWNLAILTPHLGIGAAYGLSNAGGGLSSEILYDGVAITPQQIQDVKDAFAAAGYPLDELDETGIQISSDADGYSFWVYGGTAINIFFIKVDLSAMYNLVSNSYGGAVNVRFQL
jgi:hypothetical protein